MQPVRGVEIHFKRHALLRIKSNKIIVKHDSGNAGQVNAIEGKEEFNKLYSVIERLFLLLLLLKPNINNSILRLFACTILSSLPRSTYCIY